MPEETAKPQSQLTLKSIQAEYKLEISRLQGCVAKMAHMTGQQNILTEFNIKRWEPGKEDMSRWAK